MSDLQNQMDNYKVEIGINSIISKKTGKPKHVRYARIIWKPTGETLHTTQNCPDRFVALSKARKWTLNRIKENKTNDGQSN